MALFSKRESTTERRERQMTSIERLFERGEATPEALAPILAGESTELGRAVLTAYVGYLRDSA